MDIFGVMIAIVIACPKPVPPNAPVPCAQQEAQCAMLCGGAGNIENFECSQTGGIAGDCTCGGGPGGGLMDPPIVCTAT